MREIVNEELLKKVENRFLLSIIAARRARQIKDGAVPLVERKSDDTDLTMALAELMENKITSEFVEHSAEEPRLKIIENKKKSKA